MQILGVGDDLVNELGRNGIHLQSQKIFDLPRKNAYGNAEGKADGDGFGNEFDEIAEVQKSHNDHYDTGEKRCHDQTTGTVLGDDSVNDHDKGGGWSANLYAASS